jgi:hypothetical protein
VKASG